MEQLHFCEKCHNMTGIYLREEDKKLIHYCKACETSEEVESQDKCPCVYTHDMGEMDKSYVVNRNKYITHDNVLPKLKNNPNVKCMKEDCPTHQDGVNSSITFLKYDFDNMRYMYICDECGTSWTN